MHKYPNDFRPHRLRPILLFKVEANIHNKYLGRYAMNHAEELEVIAPEQYGRQNYKSENLQALNTKDQGA